MSVQHGNTGVEAGNRAVRLICTYERADQAFLFWVVSGHQTFPQMAPQNVLQAFIMLGLSCVHIAVATQDVHVRVVHPGIKVEFFGTSATFYI